jgi:transketolase
MAAASFRLDNLWAMVDCNGIQADGPMVLDIEPVLDKWQAFGWSAVEVNGNVMQEIVDGFADLRERAGPRVLILRTTPGSGVPTLEQRDRAHFVRVDDDEWGRLTEELESRG